MFLSVRDIRLPRHAVSMPLLPASAGKRLSVRIVGAANRGTVHDVKVAWDAEALELDTTGISTSAHSFELGLAFLAKDDGARFIRVWTAGEPFEPVALIVDRGDPEDVEVFLAEGECQIRADPVVMPREDARKLADPFQVGAELMAYLNGNARQPLATYQRFFAETDSQTHPDLLRLRQQPWDHIDRLKGYLCRMVRRRAVAASTGGPVLRYRKVHPEAGAAESLHAVLVPMRTVLDRLAAMAATSFDEAFEHFANGDLRIKVPCGAWTTQPSSAMYFCFAEMALLALDQGGNDTAIWRSYARTFVRTQQIYVDAFKPCVPGPASFGDYGGCCYPGRPWQRAQILALRERFAYASDDALRHAAGTHAALAFPGGYGI